MADHKASGDEQEAFAGGLGAHQRGRPVDELKARVAAMGPTVRPARTWAEWFRRRLRTRGLYRSATYPERPGRPAPVT